MMLNSLAMVSASMELAGFVTPLSRNASSALGSIEVRIAPESLSTLTRSTIRPVVGSIETSVGTAQTGVSTFALTAEQVIARRLSALK